MERWEREARWNQKTMSMLCKEMRKLDWFDEEIWTKMATDVCSKKKVYKLHWYHDFLNGFVEANENPKSEVYGKFDHFVKALEE